MSNISMFDAPNRIDSETLLNTAASAVEAIEFDLLKSAIRDRYGHDFFCYAQPSLWRRFSFAREKLQFSTFSALQGAVLRDFDLFTRFLSLVCVSTTELFRDPEFFQTLRQSVVPHLRTYPHPVIWQAGCSIGLETISLCILLEEEGLLDKATIYATDINRVALAVAKSGVYSASEFEAYEENYLVAGGRRKLSNYYVKNRDVVLVNPELLQKVAFSTHNLAVDNSFCEAQLVVCRNVMIYFSPELQKRTLDLLDSSLCYGGFLGLGREECYRQENNDFRYIEVEPKNRIYQKSAKLS